METAALVPVQQPETSLTPLLARARDYIHQSRAASTLRSYRADFRDFQQFCSGHGLNPLPAAPETVCSYLSQCADRGLKAGSIQRRVAAIASAHTAAGLDSPTVTAPVKLCLAGIRRALGTRQEGKSPVLTSDVAAMLSRKFYVRWTSDYSVFGVRSKIRNQ